jgi:hypothetical protein
VAFARRFGSAGDSGAGPLQSDNKQREPGTYPSQFVQDAATAYAVLASVSK